MSRRLSELCQNPTLDFASRGACRGMESSLFFSEGRRLEEAQKVCATCPVAEECLAWGLCHEQHGVWGGVGVNGRRRLRRELRITCTAPEGEVSHQPRPCGTSAGFQRHRRNGEPPCEACKVAWAARKTPNSVPPPKVRRFVDEEARRYEFRAKVLEILS